MKLIASLLFLFALPLFARDITITVEDADLKLPLEGAAIRSWDGSEHICDENGRVTINMPDNRQVVVQAAYPGYETGRLAVPVTGNLFTISLRLSGIMESRELVIEAQRPGTNETRTGRSIAVGAKEIAQTAEIGLIEDVMNTIKLLPGVGYAGFFNAQPSIRGGDPGDMSAALDGYYISNPYHWGGGFSIFDPRMVQSAQLSHGVFSARYGHTISGLLEVTSKKPSSEETQFELGVNTSAANFNLSLPFTNGGILFMGRTTYYDPVVELAKGLSNEIPELEVINSVRVAPYIRSTTISGNYRFSDNLELQATFFWGMDGVGVSFMNTSNTSELKSASGIDFDWTNYQGFITASLSWNPRNDMLLKFSAGTGYEDMIIDGDMSLSIYNKEFSDDFKRKYGRLLKTDAYQFENSTHISENDFLFNAQSRIDYDWEFSDGLMISAGVQEMYNNFSAAGVQRGFADIRFSNLRDEDKKNLINLLSLDPNNPDDLAILENLRIGTPLNYSPDSENNLFTTSGYILAEYYTGSRLSAELGLRIDHFVLLGKGFTLQSEPAVNPRLNLDYNLLKNISFLQSLNISAGTGMFSSINDNVFVAEERYDVREMKPNRSWTSVLGIRMEFSESFSFNIEAYYKYIFDRMYVPVGIGLDDLDIQPKFDGEGRVWGIDLMLQKIQSRYWDGWLAYSYNWTQYRDPGGIYSTMGISGGNRGNDWYFPPYHRYHNLNLIFNIKPVPRINLYTRFGLASGRQMVRRIGDGPESYPVLIYDQKNPGKSYLIENYYWPFVADESNRTTPSLPLDIKFSIYGNNNNGKTRYELYVAVENVLALVYNAQGNTSFNKYTGQVETGSSSAAYEMPIPIPSFGFKYSY
ncbi:MAG: TonB-dependent receptor plug domain-containing protein [Treponema sp.]|nr:TonB-dependent receptor plug domain-containing protein [Treponema sp.]